MSLEIRTRRRKSAVLLIPTASMGDIAFLLIIFFMLTSNFIKEANLNIRPPVSPDIKVIEDSHISVSVDRDGLVRLQGDECPIDALDGYLSELIERRADKTVMLKIDKEVPQKTFGPVLLALSRAGAEIAMVGEQKP